MMISGAVVWPNNCSIVRTSTVPRLRVGMIQETRTQPGSRVTGALFSTSRPDSTIRHAVGLFEMNAETRRENQFLQLPQGAVIAEMIFHRDSVHVLHCGSVSEYLPLGAFAIEFQKVYAPANPVDHFCDRNDGNV